MRDRVRQNDGTDNTIQFGAIPTSVTTAADLIAYLQAGAPVDITASNTAIVSGTPLNKETLLSEGTANLLELDDDTATVDEALQTLWNKLLLIPMQVLRLVYRVGDLKETTNPENPATYYGFGTWELYGVGRTTVCLNSANTLMDTVGEQFGNANTIVPYHLHSVAAVNTGNQSANHTHNYSLFGAVTNTLQAGGSIIATTGSASTPVTGGNNTNHTHQVPAHNTAYAGTSGNMTNANYQPSIVVYRWRRVA